LGGYVSPEHAAVVEVFGLLGFEEVEAVFGVGGVVAGGAILLKDGFQVPGKIVRRVDRDKCEKKR
jgi:hypothetical protein